MLNLSKLFACLFIQVCFISCYTDKEDLLYGNTVCDTMSVSFSGDIQPIINSSCAIVGCHIQGGSGVGLFENYTQVKSKIDDQSIHRRVIIDRNMPPSGPLSDCQILHLEKWINDGAPNN